MGVRRHPVLGTLGGALIGLGLALLLVMFGAAPLGDLTVVVLVVFFAAMGLLFALVLPPPSAPVA